MGLPSRSMWMGRDRLGGRLRSREHRSVSDIHQQVQERGRRLCERTGEQMMHCSE
jgi:hypothetical protein